MDVMGSGSGQGQGYNAQMPTMQMPALAEFKAQNIVGGTQNFLDSNSYVAKAAFLILLVIIFVYVLRACIAIIGFLFSPSSSPFLLNGLVDATIGNTVIQQDPADLGAITLIRSVNEDVGIAMTWSVWIYINNSAVVADNTKLLHVFNKGSVTVDPNAPASLPNIMGPNNAPGLYLKPDYTGIVVVMSTFNQPYKYAEIDNIPINKWFNVIIRVENTTLDIFMNGVLAQRLLLDSVPFQNYGNVNVAQNNGFKGLISSLRYYNVALGTRAIQGIISDGPNLTEIGASGGAPGIMDYLSMRWFFNQWGTS